MKCFYHDDMDGRACGYLVNKRYNGAVDFIACDYSREMDLTIIQPNEEVWIVDFSFKPAEMMALCAITENIVWIDHHYTAIEKLDAFKSLKGIRRVGIAACELVHEYISGTADMPDAIRLIGDRDVWNWSYGEATAEFNAGAGVYDTHPTSEFWELHHNVIQETGRTILKFKEKYYREVRESASFEIDFHGHRTLAMNICRTGSEAFGGRLPDYQVPGYDILMAFYYNGDNWVVSLYSPKGGVDVGAIAKQYGGGGHKNAAGFHTLKTIKEITKGSS